MALSMLLPSQQNQWRVNMDGYSEKITAEISGNNVVLYMKGTSSMPQCGFSSRIAGVLNYLEIEYLDVNVL